MIRDLGLDPEEETFWDGPFAYLESLIHSLEHATLK
jgi:hypothetical protein